MLIRPCDPGDAAVLAEVLVPVFRAGETYAVDPDISSEDAVAFWCAPGKTVFLAERDGVALGTSYLRANQAGGGDHVCNCGFVTAAAAVGQGVARALLDHAMAEAQAQGFRAMQFNFVVVTNMRAIALWERAGFATVGRLPGAFRHPARGYVDALVMYRDLV